MGKTFNFYCDESTHIENDGHPYMILSYVSTPYHYLKSHNQRIREMKIRHHYIGEMKWSKLSKSQYPFYSDLIDYFFSSELQFRAIIIDKAQLNHTAHNQSHNDFYDKMYYQLLNKKIHPHYDYNIYLDIKDTHSYEKAKSLKSYLCRDYQSVRNLQIIRSYESELMQLTDVLMGALNYKIRGLNRVTAKNNIIAKIEKHTQHNLTRSTSRDEDKFNLFFIDLSHGF
ncbi:DUF3800 domain-containing protein [Sphingobacterium faecale]|uniref:DUF3800 domain-containing protein n=1 Tax=Sphingobacterium faecale TaxID=2803775 RepID=A0ABS1RA31_9SPHI|nr:DUF3800 domain-containing protein [Sphingobacterium faecale]MBL1411533.1 DUF3800 domain-containing protein [Sphingobacterium faecale]